ncbi:MAG TPA: hypothetical protein VM011_05800 [Gammaproteobacteria bacterium]|nr:hypothetical protein [Gammaproteobacteria bacterium]
MQNRQQDRRINGAALEIIMQDVLRGIQDFTRDACCGCHATSLEILGVEDAGNAAVRTAEVLPFPAARGDIARG